MFAKTAVNGSDLHILVAERRRPHVLFPRIRQRLSWPM
jgi:hypothetical protein